MNISRISFGTEYNSNLSGRHIKRDAGYKQEVYVNQDTFEPQTRIGKHEKKEPYQAKHLAKSSIPETPKYQQGAMEYLTNNKKKTARKRTLISAAGGALAAVMLAHGISVYSQPAKLISVPTNNYNNIYEISETYNCDAKAIMAYNNFSDASDFIKAEEIKVPTMYSNLQGEIDEIQNKLYNNELNTGKREGLETRLSKLKEKQSLQNKVATVYTDGKYVYFTINKSNGGINVEEFKEIFDIKDKAIRQNNDIEFSWGYEAETGGYKDYTTAILTPGMTVKVPADAIKTGSGINLD